MATQIILLVHGMGTHAPGEMTGTFVRALNDRARGFGLADFDAAAEECRIEEFNYSALFDDVRKQFAENAAARQEGFGYLIGRGIAADVVSELTELAAKFGNDDFLYTHWLDVLLYATTYYGEAVRAKLAEQYHLLVSTHGHENIHVVGHSLGTAVVHDTLAKLYRDGANIFDDIPDYAPGNFNMGTLWMFANVSSLVHLLNDLEDPMTSTVVPGGAGCTGFLYNVSHKLDPFTWFERYSRQADDLVSMENSVVRNINTHDFYEYVTAPKIVREMLATFFRKRVTDEAYEACVRQYRESSLTAGVTELKSHLEAVRDDPGMETLKKAYTAFKVLTDAVKRG
jgi:hypothetical protein